MPTCYLSFLSRGKIWFHIELSSRYRFGTIWRKYGFIRLIILSHWCNCCIYFKWTRVPVKIKKNSKCASCNVMNILLFSFLFFPLNKASAVPALKVLCQFPAVEGKCLIMVFGTLEKRLLLYRNILGLLFLISGFILGIAAMHGKTAVIVMQGYSVAHSNWHANTHM